MLRKELGLFLLILVIGGVTAFINPQFVSQVNLTNLANQIGLFGLLSIGLGLVIITGGIDLSVGSMVARLGIIFLDIMVDRDFGWPLALAVTILGGTLLGTVHGLLITRLKLQPFVVTLCGLLLYRGIARWYTADSTRGLAMAAAAKCSNGSPRGEVGTSPILLSFSSSPPASRR
jgi:ribose transport system permease protein